MPSTALGARDSEAFPVLWACCDSAPSALRLPQVLPSLWPPEKLWPQDALGGQQRLRVEKGVRGGRKLLLEITGSGTRGGVSVEPPTRCVSTMAHHCPFSPIHDSEKGHMSFSTGWRRLLPNLFCYHYGPVTFLSPLRFLKVMYI